MGESEVAPFTVAWIEMSDSQPIRIVQSVAPFTGAWIEICHVGFHVGSFVGRALHGRVD